MLVLPAVEQRAFVLCAFLAVAASACDNPPTAPGYSGRVKVGYIKVSLPTTGVDRDDAFDVLSDTTLRQVSANEATVFEVREGVHSVELRGIANNCVVDGGVVRSVNVKESDTTLVVFSIQCTGGPVTGEIAFVEESTLMLMKANGSDQSRLNRGWQPSWSRDGNKIVYSATDCDDYGCSGSLEIVDPKTREITPLTKTLFSVNPAWSPVEDVIAYTNIESGDLYLYDIATDTAWKVILPRQMLVYHPSWSPDGGRIVAACYEGSFRGQICVFNRDGADFHYLNPRTETDDRNPSWSPDGNRIVFERDGSGLFVMYEDGSGLRPLGTAGSWPSWSPDSREILFAAANGIFRIRSDGTEVRRLTTGPNYSHYTPVWKR